MNIIYMAPGDITPYGQNAKKHPEEQVEHIANSIREFGWQQPLVVDKDNVLVIGHGRLMAAKKLGLEQVPVVRADQLTEQQIAALRLADNKTNESDWDFDLLDLELEGIDEIDMFALVALDTKQVGYILNGDMPMSITLRCDDMRGTYYDEQGLKHYNDIMKLKGKMSQQEIADTLGISKTIVNKMCCKTYKPHISNARYFSDIIREADWFEQI